MGNKLDLKLAMNVIFGIRIRRDGFVSEWELTGGSESESDHRRVDIDYSTFGVTRKVQLEDTKKPM